ncbi:MAG: RT0821/Lpp0805 family surface protein [Pseudomonadota bacterium]
MSFSLPRVSRLALLLAASLTLSGCIGPEGFSFGRSSPPEPVQQPEDLGLRLSPEVRNLLAADDAPFARKAQADALDNGRTGTAVAWRNPRTGTAGEVVPGPDYSVNGRGCRDITHIVPKNGARSSVRNVACRDEQGSWILVEAN